MEEDWLLNLGGRPTVEEPKAEMESQRAKRILRIRGARVGLKALSTEAEVEIQRSAAEPERLRTKVERVGGRSPTELVVWSAAGGAES